ncbi:MAG TPA: TlpA disulfide reductase family protein [Polyangia bacterium]|nr:TlpA disulfide reductase family protein [Polyangia bacterium]
MATAAAALLALLLQSQAQGLASPAPAIGDPAPALVVEDSDGRPLPPVDLTGHVTVVDFFATWCQPCKLAHRDLAALAETFGGGVTFHFVDVGEGPEALRRFLAGWPPPKGARVLLDRAGGNAQRWGQDRFPTTFLVDAGGVIRHVNRGWGDGYRARLARWLRAMLMAATATAAPARAAPPR